MKKHCTWNPGEPDATGQKINIISQESALEAAGTMTDLMEDRGRIETFIDAIPASIFVADIDFRILYQNSHNRNEFGEQAGERCFSACYARKAVCDECLVAGVFSVGETQRAEKEALLADGSRRQMEFNVSPVRDSSGKIVAAIKLARDITERKHSEWQLASFNAVSSILAESPTLEEAIPRVLEAICRAIGWDMGEIWWVNQQKDSLLLYDTWHKPDMAPVEFMSISKELTFARGIGLPGRVWASGQASWIHDILEDLNFPRRYHANKSGLHGAFAFPVILGGVVMGVMGFFSRDARDPDPGLLSAMAPLGIQLGQLMERKEIEHSLRESERRFRETLENINLLAIELDRNGKIIFCNDFALDVTGWRREDLLGRNWFGIMAPDSSNLMASYEEWISTENMPRHHVSAIMTRDGASRIVSWNITVLYASNGATTGVACIGEDITERRRAEEKLIYLSSHDAMTGLYNRAFFEVEINRLAGGRQFPVGIITIDVDGLKAVNDKLGHDVGDKLIKMAAKVLAQSFRSGDMVARTGGDEFIVLLPKTDAIDAAEAVKRIRRYEEDANTAKNGLHLSMSIGVATANEKLDIHAALKMSDELMYKEKFVKKDSKTTGIGSVMRTTRAAI